MFLSLFTTFFTNTTLFLCHCLSQFQNKRYHKSTFQNNIHSLLVLELFSGIKTFPMPSHINTGRKLLLHMSGLCTSDACLSLQSRLKRYVLPNDHLLRLSEEPVPPCRPALGAVHTLQLFEASHSVALRGLLQNSFKWPYKW